MNDTERNHNNDEQREEFPTGNAFLDKWGPRFVDRKIEFMTATLFALPLNLAFLVYLFFSDTDLLWSVVSGASVVVVTVLFIMAICEIIRNIYLNVQDEKRAERDRWLAEQERLKKEAEEAAARQREAEETTRKAAVGQRVTEEPQSVSPVVDEMQKNNLPELQPEALVDALLPALTDAGVVLTRTDMQALIAAMLVSRVVRFSGISFREISRLATLLAYALGNFRADEYGMDGIGIIPLDGTDGEATNRTLTADRDKIRMPFVDEADRKKEFLPDMAQDNWNDCRIWYFVLTNDAYTALALDDWSVTLSLLPTVELMNGSAAPVASAASLQVLSGRAPQQYGSESFFDAVDALDDFLTASLRTAPSNPLIRLAERFAAAAQAVGFSTAETVDRFLSCVRLPALLREKQKTLSPDDLTALGEKINALFGYDNLPLSRKLLDEVPRQTKTVWDENA